MDFDRFRQDPLLLVDYCWPHIKGFYKEQVEALDSVVTNDETYVVAGHQLGKDYLAGYCALWFFLVHHPVRVVTTSVKDDHLRVLFGEIGRFIDECKYPLDYKRGGPLVIKHREIRKVVDGKVDKISYLVGMVSEHEEGLAGHHAKYTLAIIDEASGVANGVKNRIDTWAKRKLIIGNAYGGRGSFFCDDVKGGDIEAVDD